MPAREGARDRARRRARALQRTVADELRDARLAAGVGQAQVAQRAGLTQSQVSRTERSDGRAPHIDDLATHAAALGLRLSIKLYPDGSPVRDAAQLRLIGKLRDIIGDGFIVRTEVLAGGRGDLRAWDVVLDGPIQIAIDAETRLHDIQALQRRLELKRRDSRMPRVILLVAASRHNRSVLREHREALSSTLPLDSANVLEALREGRAPEASGILVL